VPTAQVALRPFTAQPLTPTPSPIIYACAGLLMNLELRAGRLAFAFTRADWPMPRSERPSWKLVAAAVPLMLVAGYVLVAFVS